MTTQTVSEMLFDSNSFFKIYDKKHKDFKKKYKAKSDKLFTSFERAANSLVSEVVEYVSVVIYTERKNIEKIINELNNFRFFDRYEIYEFNIHENKIHVFSLNSESILYHLFIQFIMYNLPLNRVIYNSTGRNNYYAKFCHINKNLSIDFNDNDKDLTTIDTVYHTKKYTRINTADRCKRHILKDNIPENAINYDDIHIITANNDERSDKTPTREGSDFNTILFCFKDKNTEVLFEMYSDHSYKKYYPRDMYTKLNDIVKKGSDNELFEYMIEKFNYFEGIEESKENFIKNVYKVVARDTSWEYIMSD